MNAQGPSGCELGAIDTRDPMALRHEPWSVSRLLLVAGSAIAPWRVVICLVLVVSVYSLGQVMDWAMGPAVAPGEIALIDQGNWADAREAIQDLRDDTAERDLRGRFASTGAMASSGVRSLLSEAFDFNLGVSDGGGVIGALRGLFYELPKWSLLANPVFTLIWGGLSLAIMLLLGLSASYLAGADAVYHDHRTPDEAVRYAARHLLQLAFPVVLVPLVCIAVGGVMWLGGLLFNVPGLDVLAAAVFGLWLIGGLLIAAVSLLYAVGLHLMPAAVAIDDADGFDTVTRSFHYAAARPLRYGVYQLINLAMGGLVYLIAATVVGWTLAVTRAFVSLAVFREGDFEDNRFHELMPSESLSLWVWPNWDDLGGLSDAAALGIALWVKLLLLIPAAVVVSYYFTSQVWVYLLLRRAADGAGLDETEIPREPAIEPEPLEDF